MDPWFGLRFTGKLDPAAEMEFLDPSPRTREIMTAVGMGELLKFVDDRENLDYDDEYVHLMSHPDTHAAYQRAYYIWKAERESKQTLFEPGDDRAVQELVSLLMGLNAQEPLDRGEVGKAEAASHGDEASEPQASGQEPDTSAVASLARSDKSPLPPALEAELSAVQGGIWLDPDNETEPPPSQRSAIYVYRDSDPIKARCEWPAYVSDDEYLTGLWKANLVRQLQWYCPRPAPRSATYRAPTWSWACLDGARIWYENRSSSTSTEGDNYFQLPRVVDARVVTKEDGRFGDARSARITMLAHVRDMPFYHDWGVAAETDQEYSPDDLEVVVRTPGEPFPGKHSEIVRDQPKTILEPTLKLLRLENSCSLIVEPVGSLREPIVLRRVGLWRCNNAGFSDYDGHRGMVGWEEKLITLI